MEHLTEQRPSTARYARPTNLLDRPDAIVIGSGLGGLGVASALAQKRGLRVLVLEGCAVPGGSTRVHEVAGFEFPAGLHSVGEMDLSGSPPSKAACAAAFVSGNQLAWARMPEPHEWAFIGDEGFPWHSTAEDNVAHFATRELGAGDARSYFELERRVQRAGLGWALTKLLPEGVPVLVREGLYRLLSGAWRRYLKRDTHQVLRGELGFSEKRAALFEYMYANYGRTPDAAPFTLHAAVMHHYRQGAYYPVGGPGSVALAIIPVIEAAGGQVAAGTAVEEIVVEGNRAAGVRLRGGGEVRAPLVISDASAHTTFARLLPQDVAARHGYLDRLERVGSSPAHLALLVGWAEELELPRHIVWQLPRFHPDLPLHDVSGGDRLYKAQMRFEGMPAYLMSPSARDPLHRQRYPNKSTALVLVEASRPWLARASVDPGFRDELEGRFQEAGLKLLQQHFPAARGRTPALVRVRYPMGCNPWARDGGSYGLEASGERFLVHTHWLRARTRVDGLFLTGQDPFMPGIGAVLVGSRVTYAAITRDFGHVTSAERSRFAPPREPPRLAATAA